MYLTGLERRHRFAPLVQTEPEDRQVMERIAEMPRSHIETGIECRGRFVSDVPAGPQASCRQLPDTLQCRDDLGRCPRSDRFLESAEGKGSLGTESQIIEASAREHELSVPNG